MLIKFTDSDSFLEIIMFALHDIKQFKMFDNAYLMFQIHEV